MRLKISREEDMLGRVGRISYITFTMCGYELFWSRGLIRIGKDNPFM